MTLDTQTMGISRHWFSAVIKNIPGSPDLFSKKEVCKARKLFLAGTNQLTSIRNWLIAGGIIEKTGGAYKLSDLGNLIAGQDNQAESAWTWWLFHLHLCANSDAFPYSTFFVTNESDSPWKTQNEMKDLLIKQAPALGVALAAESISSTFNGVAQTFYPGFFVNDLGLIEVRGKDEAPSKKFRRKLCKPADIVICYATVLFKKQFFSDDTTVDARALLGRGLAKALGMIDSDVRESLSRIHTDKIIGHFLQYRNQVNLDSLQFPKPLDLSLREIRANAYGSQAVKWQ